MIDGIAISRALHALGGAGSFGTADTDTLNEAWYEKLAWQGGSEKPALAVLVAKMAEMKTAEDATQYARDRAREMPPLQDLIVAMWETQVEGRTAEDAGIPALQAARLTVKAKYPKP